MARSILLSLSGIYLLPLSTLPYSSRPLARPIPVDPGPTLYPFLTAPGPSLDPFLQILVQLSTLSLQLLAPRSTHSCRSWSNSLPFPYSSWSLARPIPVDPGPVLYPFLTAPGPSLYPFLQILVHISTLPYSSCRSQGPSLYLSPQHQASLSTNLPASDSSLHPILKILSYTVYEYTLQRTNTENSKHIFPQKELRGKSPIFRIHVSVSDLFIHTIDLPILLQEICGPILGMYQSLPAS